MDDMKVVRVRVEEASPADPAFRNLDRNWRLNTLAGLPLIGWLVRWLYPELKGYVTAVDRGEPR